MVTRTSARYAMTFIPKVLLALALFGCLACLAILLLWRTVGRERTMTIVASFVTILVSSMIAIVCAEFATRWIFSDVTTTSDSSYFAMRWKRSHPPRTNAIGFRDRDYDQTPGAGIYRIAVVGDSLAYGQGIEESQRFSDLLEQDLNADAVRYEVLNFAIPGAETVDHIEILKESVVPAGPDFVILQWFINDVENGDYDNRPRHRRLIPSDTIENFLRKHSALFYLVNLGWQGLQVKSDLSRSYVDYMVERFSDPSTESSRVADEALNAFLDICESENIPVGVALFPQLSVDLGSDYPFAFLHERVVALCDQRQLDCLDLRFVYSTHKPANRLWANRLDAHPGPLANRIAADEIRRVYGDQWEAYFQAKNARIERTGPPGNG